ncbi:DNA-binding protein [Pseudomonas gingeri]|uniref:DNA-binding protein n=1 Tax=Pseudomonas gingeri TaxID=117681 RepID=UPI0015A3F4C8|nr:DNA-binding protein [Pseudomonas gingeri]NVZ64364.1 DNA-binding protein [Pseudomonas gingeri]NVZ75957.1 DNA-binding protein [Pseudomonas gingeri]
MAVGVPENDVFAAADAVLARGERPTVERVRLELGRGSPARVGGLLDQWWARLAERLKGETRLPALPGEVSQAFVAVWQQAIQLAQGVVEKGLAEQRQVLDTERERIAAAEDQARQDMVKARQQVVEAAAGRQSAELRLADLELLLSHRQTQIDDLQQQRESLAHERLDSQQRIQVLQKELQASRLKAEQERVGQETYVRGVEDRAHREVDHAREESKAMAVQLKDAGRQVDQSLRRLASIQAELNQAQQLTAAQVARAETLEQQLNYMRQLPETERKPRVRKNSTSRDPKA